MPLPESQSDNRLRWFVYLVFFLSGAAGLIYEISWSRQIGLLFGHTVHAASIVLASYFAGMAIGYCVGAKWSSRVSPLFGYGIAELAVGAWAFAVPFLLRVSEMEAFAPWLTSDSVAWQTASRAVFSFLLLLPGTIALGVTLPMMAEFLSDNAAANQTASTQAKLNQAKINHQASSQISLAYAINTFGAFVGVLTATFGLLVFVGVQKSSYVAAALSIVCALLAFTISRKKGNNKNEANNLLSDSTIGSDIETSPSSFNTFQNTGWFGLAFISGFGTLALQVLYSRMFSLVFHNSTYTFGVIVAVFLAALAIGAALASKLQKRFCPRWLLGVSACLGAITIAGSVSVFIALTDLQYFSSGETFVKYISGAVGLVAVVVGPPVVFFGMMLPLIWRLAVSSATKSTTSLENAGKIVGLITAVNTIAAACGALMASFVLLPMLGLWESIVLIAVAFFAGGCAVLWRKNDVNMTNQQPQHFRVTAGLFAVCLCVASVFALSSPVDLKHEEGNWQDNLVQRWSSAYGWIDIVERENTGVFKVRQNLHYRFGATGSNVREYRQSHLPILLHPNPQEVLFMGLGTGLTAGGAIPHAEVKHIDVVELIPEVVQAARFLAEHNYNVVDHEKVDVYVDDARHHLLATKKEYDLIVSDLFVPWESESGYLYTVEHYQVAQAKMKPDGLFCQWLPVYQVSKREFEMIANSFASVFPNTTIWWGRLGAGAPVIALIGSNEKLKVDSYQLGARLRGLNRELGSLDSSIATPLLVWNHYIGDWDVEAALARNPSHLNTDEHPRVEFLTPISIRDRNMLQRGLLKRYFDEVLMGLDSTSELSDNDNSPEATRLRRMRQREGL